MAAQANKIWDLPTRLFHWGVAGLVVFSFITVKQGLMEWHALSGRAILTLVLFRIFWGIWGSTTSRFSHFLKGPRTVLAYLGSLFTGKPEKYAGHNPAGGWVGVAIILALLTQASMGLFTDDDIFFRGPLAHLVSGSTARSITGLHVEFSNLILGLAILHVLAILFYALWLKRPLWRDMIGGGRGDRGNANRIAKKPVARALLLLALSAAFVWLVIPAL